MYNSYMYIDLSYVHTLLILQSIFGELHLRYPMNLIHAPLSVSVPVLVVRKQAICLIVCYIA